LQPAQSLPEEFIVLPVLPNEHDRPGEAEYSAG